MDLRQHYLATLRASKVGHVLGQLLHIGQRNRIVVACPTPQISYFATNAEQDVSDLPNPTNASMTFQPQQHASFRPFQELLLSGGIFNPEADVHSAPHTFVIDRLVDFWIRI